LNPKTRLIVSFFFGSVMNNLCLLSRVFVDTCDDEETFTVPIAIRTVLFAFSDRRRAAANGRKAEKEKQTKIDAIAGRTANGLEAGTLTSPDTAALLHAHCGTDEAQIEIHMERCN
jgi:hypothetical protein